MKNILLLCAASLFLAGCVGGVVCRAKTKTFVKPTLEDSRSSEGVHKTPDHQKPPTYSSTWVKTNWGEPSEIHRGRGDGEEVWIYEFTPLVVGAVPCVILPIPLIVPNGKESVALTFRNGRVISARQRTGAASAATYGFMFGPCGPSGFGHQVF